MAALVLYSLYCIVDFVGLKTLEQKLWEWLKIELLYVGGACQHSGQCCRRITLVRNGEKVATLSDYEVLIAKDPVFERFRPTWRGTGIDHFSCQCLTPDNRCNDYENRPTLCRQYPFSTFVQEDQIHAGCGYFIAQKQGWFRPKHPKVVARIKDMQQSKLV